MAHAARKLDAALAELTPDDRALVHLHYYEGQSLAEIGAVLGVTRDALKMRGRRMKHEREAGSMKDLTSETPAPRRVDSPPRS